MPAWLSVNSSRAAGLYGQALASLVTFGQTIVYARTMPAAEFGLFAMAISALLVSQILQRNVVVIPMIVAQGEHRTTALRPWTRINTGIIVLTLAVIAIVAAATPFMGHAGGLTFALCEATAVALPTTMLYEFVRRTLFLEQRYAAAIRMAAVHFGLQCAGIGLVVATGQGALAAMTASAVAAGVAVLSARASLNHAETDGEPSAQSLLAKYRSDMIWSLGVAVPYAAFNNGLPMLLGMLAGPSMAGLFTASRLLLAPITTLAGAVDMVDKPRAARGLREGGRAGLLASLRNTMLSMLGLSAAYLLIGGWFADEILRLAYGSKLALQPGSAWLWMVVGILMMFGQPTETGLLVLRRAHWFFWSRSVAMAVGLVVLMWAIVPFGYVAGIWSMVLAWLVSGAMAAVMLGAALARLSAKSPEH